MKTKRLYFEQNFTFAPGDEDEKVTLRTTRLTLCVGSSVVFGFLIGCVYITNLGLYFLDIVDAYVSNVGMYVPCSWLSEYSSSFRSYILAKGLLEN